VAWFLAKLADMSREPPEEGPAPSAPRPPRPLPPKFMGPRLLEPEYPLRLPLPLKDG
jgi:hypothetical protein